MSQESSNGPPPDTEGEKKQKFGLAPAQATELAGHPFLRDLGAERVRAMSQYAFPVQYRDNEFLFHENEAALHFYFIFEGRIAVGTFAEASGAIVVQTIGKGEILGWSCLIPPHQWRFDARATESTRGVALDGKSLCAHCERDHDFGYEILKRLSIITAQRLEMTRLQLVSVYDAPASRKRSGR